MEMWMCLSALERIVIVLETTDRRVALADLPPAILGTPSPCTTCVSYDDDDDNVTQQCLDEPRRLKTVP
jgi:hypothetical protein